MIAPCPVPCVEVVAPAPAGDLLTLNAELRLRHDSLRDGSGGGEHGRELMRAVLGANLQVNPNLRVRAEVGAGQVSGWRGPASASFQNDAALQQLFVEARGQAGETTFGVVAGRQEFADGPRQLLSVGDGPNLHRSWNGVRLYAQRPRLRLGAFDLRATRLEPGAFDESVNHDRRLWGLNASFEVGPAGAAHLDPFWIHSDTGADQRDTYGARLWGRRGPLSFDWTLARQAGEVEGVGAVEAWGLFAVQSVTLSQAGWKPRLTGRLDVASGGDRGRFDPLYASSSYLGEGQFLGLSNLLLVTPGLSVSPAPGANLTVEYGLARRMRAGDAAYAGGARPYGGTRAVPGHGVGGLLRLSGTWPAGPHMTWNANYERLAPGPVLRRAGHASAVYSSVGITFRY